MSIIKPEIMSTAIAVSEDRGIDEGDALYGILFRLLRGTPGAGRFWVKNF